MESQTGEEAPGFNHGQQLRNLSFALIHNNNDERNKCVRLGIETLVKSMKTTFDTEYFEVSYQPEIIPLSLEQTLARKKMLFQLKKDWSKYRQKNDHFGLSPPPEKAGDQKAGAIEMNVTDKHIRTWDIFLQSDRDYLVCFEDDATLPESSFTKFIMAIDKASSYPANMPLYADLAGGFPLSLLGVETLFERRDDFFVFFKKPVTNTACCYFLNKAMVKNFKEILSYNPALRNLAVDWMINKLLIELDKKKKPSVCFHTEPPIFQHGSMVGHVPAWRTLDNRQSK